MCVLSPGAGEWVGQGHAGAPLSTSSPSLPVPASCALPPQTGHSLELGLHCGHHRQGQAHSQLAPIRDSMRSRRLWRSRWTMKSSSDKMRKEEMQLTIRRIPLAMESNRLLPSVTRMEGNRLFSEKDSLTPQVLSAMARAQPFTTRQVCGKAFAS